MVISSDRELLVQLSLMCVFLMFLYLVLLAITQRVVSGRGGVCVVLIA